VPATLRPLVIRLGTAIVGLVLLAGCTSDSQSTSRIPPS